MRNGKKLVWGAALLAALLFAGCPLEGDVSSSRKNNGGTKGGANTWARFNNKEVFPATVYGDSARQTVLVEVEAQNSATAAVKPSEHTTFYPTFYLDIFGVPGIHIPYNGPGIVAVIQEGQTNEVPIPALESFSTGFAYLVLENASAFSLLLKYKDAEKTPLGGSSGIIMSGKTVVYELTPTLTANYTILKNTTDPLSLAGFTEFKQDFIYKIKYEGTALTLTESKSALSKVPPPAPENVRAETETSSSVRISWEEANRASSYNVYRSTSEAGTYSKVNTLAVSETSYTDTTVVANTVYYYYIRSVTSDGVESKPSNTAAATTLLPATGNPQARAASSMSISLSWDIVSGAGGYNVYRSGTETGTYSKVNAATVSGSAHTDTGLTTNTTYYYKVCAVSSGGLEGEQSNVFSATTLLAAPGNLRVTNATVSNISLEWDTIIGESGYNVYRSTSETGNYSKVNTTLINGTTYTDTGLTANTTYYYKVFAVASGNIEGDWSSVISVTTLPPAPGNVRVTAATASSVILTWNAVSGASYNVYRSTSETGSYGKVNAAPISGTTYTDSSFTTVTMYYYKVSTITGGGEGEKSDAVFNATIVPGSGLAAKLTWLQSNAASNTVYGIVINANESIASASLSYSGKTNITIILKGDGTMRTVSLSANGVLFRVESGVTLILDNDITLKGKTGNNNAVVGVNSGGSLLMNEVTKITSNSAYYGGGIAVSGGTFTMNGGEISGNTASSSGGGIYVSDGGTFTMNGGKISDNTASSGGGVIFGGGTFTMNGGEISGNTASSSSGGGIYVFGGTFTMNSGVISGNTAYTGGGVYVLGNGAIFHMSNGVIYGTNAAASLKNTANNGAALACLSNATAQYGTFSGDTFTRKGDLVSTNDTVRVVNGVLLTE